MTRLARFFAPCAFAAASSFAARTATAQAIQGEFSVQRFEPAPGPHNYLTVEQLQMEGDWSWSAGLLFNYANRPFVLRSCFSQNNCASPNSNQGNDTRILEDLLTWDLLGSISPIDFLQIGLRVPLVYASGQGITDAGTPSSNGISAFGLGDVNLEGKFRIFGKNPDPVRIGLAGDVGFPTGNATAKGAYIGTSTPITGAIRGIFDGEQGPVSFGANLRGVFREQAKVGTTVVGPVDFRYSGGFGFKVSPILRLTAEGFGSTQFTSQNGTNTLEIDGAAHIHPLDTPVIFTLGGGAGILGGIGVPTGRAIAGILFVREIKDTDGDGIPDDVDKCPTLPEDFDGFEDADGCPDPDNDKDGVPDEKDRCPNVPGPPENNGCPWGDRDGDGIPDSEDKCPDEGGKIVIRNPKSPYYGCPDRDGDGIPDKIDKCPDEPEDFDGFEDADGCPDPDNDKDGIPDELDECINEPETYNGFQDHDGCPDTIPGVKGSLVEVGASEIKILETVEFETGRATIKGARSFLVLDAVAGALKGHAEILSVEVQGHTDNLGVASQNRDLSQKRAEAVTAYLQKKGVDGGRLSPKGYGPDKPVTDNATSAGRQRNRRVQFAILKTAPRPGTPPPAAPAAAAPQAAPSAAPPATPAPPAKP